MDQKNVLKRDSEEDEMAILNSHDSNRDRMWKHESFSIQWRLIFATVIDCSRLYDIE